MKIRSGFVSNSSSSSFVLDTKLSLEEITVKLHMLLDFYNDFFDQELEFDEVFRKPFIANKVYSTQMKESWGYTCEVGKKVIESAWDNSIPYALFEMIREKFDGYRNHLG